MMNVMQCKRIDSPDADRTGVYANPRHVTDVRGVLESGSPLEGFLTLNCFSSCVRPVELGVRMLLT